MADVVIRPNQYTVQPRRSVVQVVEVGFGEPSSDSPLEQPTRLAIAPTNGQTVFTLPSTPAAPHLSQVYLNGVKAVYGVDYTINTSVLAWLGVTLSAATDTLEVYY